MQASDFTTLIPDCCADVLETMYFTSVLDSAEETGESDAGESDAGASDAGESQDSADPSVPDPSVPDHSAPDHSFSLEFVGEVRGRFGLALSDATARSLTANFLGEDDAVLAGSEVGETVGELANMLCGSVMSRVRASEKFVLSHPVADALIPRSRAGGSSVVRVATDAGELLLWIVVDGSQ